MQQVTLSFNTARCRVALHEGKEIGLSASDGCQIFQNEKLTWQVIIRVVGNLLTHIYANTLHMNMLH